MRISTLLNWKVVGRLFTAVASESKLTAIRSEVTLKKKTQVYSVHNAGLDLLQTTHLTNATSGNVLLLDLHHTCTYSRTCIFKYTHIHIHTYLHTHTHRRIFTHFTQHTCTYMHRHAHTFFNCPAASPTLTCPQLGWRQHKTSCKATNLLAPDVQTPTGSRTDGRSTTGDVLKQAL